LSARAFAYLSNSLSRSFVSTAMSDKYGLMPVCSAFQRQRSRVRKRSARYQRARGGKWRRCAELVSPISSSVMIKGSEALHFILNSALRCWVTLCTTFSTPTFHRSSASSTCPNPCITCNVTSRRNSCSNTRYRDSSRTEAAL
jgi:hypothetical protein